MRSVPPDLQDALVQYSQPLSVSGLVDFWNERGEEKGSGEGKALSNPPVDIA